MTVEELQIVISAKTQGVRDKIDKLKKDIAGIQPKKMPQLNVSTDKAQGSLKKLQAEVDRTQAKISKLNEKANSIFAQQDAIAEKYKGLPGVTGMSKDQSYDYMVGNDPQMQKLNAQLDTLDAKMAPLKAHLAETKEQIASVGSAAEPAAEKTRRLGESMKQTGRQMQSAGRSSGYFGRMVGSMMLSMALYAGVSFVAKSLAEGFQYMAKSSAQANATMSQLSTNSLYLKNSFAAGLYPIVQAMTPAFTALSNAIAGALQKVAEFFAALNGQKSVTAAKQAQVDYAKTVADSGNDLAAYQAKQQAATEKAAAAQEKLAQKQAVAEQKVQKEIQKHQAKVDALKKSVMGFDELNILSDNKDDTWEPPTVPDYSAQMAAAQPDLSSIKWNGMPSAEDMFQQVQIPQQVSDLANKIKQILNDLKIYLIGTALLALGVILTLTGNPVIGIPLMIAGAATLVSAIAMNWGSMSNQVKGELSNLLIGLGAFLLVIGIILTLTGANLPLGIGLMVAGAASLAAAAALNWGSMKTSISAVMTALLVGVSAGVLVLGAVLAFSGANLPLGIGLIVAGAVGLAAATVLNWGGISKNMQATITAVAMIVGGSLLVLGAVLAFTGINLPLGIALMAVGAATLATAVALKWDSLSKSLQEKISFIASIVGGSLLALGAILALSGVNLPLGIAFLVIGAASLGTAIALKWNSMSDALRNKLIAITRMVGGFTLALGIILALTGLAAGLGIALIAVGAASLATSVALSWNSTSDRIKTVLKTIGSIAAGASIAIGLILCLTGAGIPLGVGLILAGIAGSVAVSISNNPITNFVKGILNGIIGGFESAVNWIISMLDKISFKVPDWVAGIGGKTFGINIQPLHVPRLAEGGLAAKSTLANIGEGAYQEAVLPLSDDVYAKIAQGIIKNAGLKKDTQLSAAVVSVQSKVDESSVRSTKDSLTGLTASIQSAAKSRKAIVADETDYTTKKYQTVTASLSDSMPAFLDGVTTQVQETSKTIQDDTNSKWNSIHTFLSGKFSGIAASANTNFATVEATEETNFAQAQQDVQSKSASMYSAASAKFKAIAKDANDYFGRVKASAQSYMSGTYSVVDSDSRKTANSISTNIGGAINGVVSGINAVLSAVGSSKSVKPIAVAHYAYGTGYHPGGPAIVNDQQGSTYREAVQYPDGRTFIPEGRNVLLPNLPRGSAVMPAPLTAKTFKYASGVGQFFGTSAADMQKQLVDYIFAAKDPQKILQTAVDAHTQKSTINEPWMSMQTSTVKYLASQSATALKGLIQKFIEQSNGTAEALIRVASSQVGNTSPKEYWDFAGFEGAWCDMFVSWCLKHAGIKEGYGSYVPNTMNWYKQRNRWTNTGARGDLIFYDWNHDKTPDHIGIVESLTNGIVNTIEGNTTGPNGGTGVYRKQRTMGADILGYALPMFTGSSGLSTGSGVERWRSLAAQALQMTGHYSAHNVDLLLAQMNTESSGQVNPADYKDVNYYAGHASKGLMQLIPETFASYAMPGYNSDILDPLSNILASIRYTWSRYGSANGVWGQGHGYANGIGRLKWGGWNANGGVFTAPTIAGLGDDGAEAALPLNERTYNQIAQGIYDAEKKDSTDDYELLRMAFASALREEGGNGSITVNSYVDSERVAQKVYTIEKRDRQRGRV